MQPYHTMNINELEREAEHQDNALALAIIDETMIDDHDEIECLLADVAEHFSQEINDHLREHFATNYESSDTSEFDFLWEMPLDRDQLRDGIKALHDCGDISDAVMQANLDNLDLVIDEINGNMDHYLELEITHNYAAPRSISLASACVGEIEESIDLVDHQIPELFYSDQERQARFRELVLEGIQECTLHKDSDLIYRDYSGSYVNLVIHEEHLIAYLVDCDAE